MGYRRSNIYACRVGEHSRANSPSTFLVLGFREACRDTSSASRSESVSSPVCAQHGETNISTHNNQSKQDELEEKPSPASTASFLLILIRLVCILAVVLWCASSAAGTVQILGFHLDDVVVIGEFTSLGRETEVSDTRQLDVGDVEARGPFVFFLVLKFDLQ